VSDYDCNKPVCVRDPYSGQGFCSASSSGGIDFQAEKREVGSEFGCPCVSDYECRRKTKCVESHYGGQKTCQDGGGGFARPTPAPTVKGQQCCDDPHKIPTECEVEILIEMMDIAIQSNRKLAAQWLRLAFHDAGTFNVNTNEGGANGCLMTHFPMTQEPENGFLNIPISTLEAIKINWEGHPETCLDVSAADMIQFAGHFSALRQTDTPGIDFVKIADLMTFEWGRSDEPNCDTAWTHNLPGFQGLVPPSQIGDLPQRCLMAGKEIKDKMILRNGFSAMESVALLGAHTIGLTRNSFGASLAAPWVLNGADAATPQGPIFDNGYHHYLEHTLVADDAPTFSADQTPVTQPFPDWFRDPTFGNQVNHLDTDITIAFPTQDPAMHPDYRAHTVAFANDNDLFLKRFFEALKKMGMLGVDDELSVPTECDPDCVGSGADLDADVVIKVVRDVGEAESVGEQELTQILATDEFTEQREFSTQELSKEDILVKEAIMEETIDGPMK